MTIEYAIKNKISLKAYCDYLEEIAEKNIKSRDKIKKAFAEYKENNAARNKVE